jgi:hypothetical protein
MEVVPPLDQLAGSEGWLARLLGEGYGAGLPLNSSSPALEASRIVKAGAGTLFGISGFNNGATQFILAFDVAGAVPADGTVPNFAMQAAASSNFFVSFDRFGRAFDRGIVICNSSTIATKTIGSANCWFDAQYI